MTTVIRWAGFYVHDDSHRVEGLLCLVMTVIELTAFCDSCLRTVTE